MLTELQSHAKARYGTAKQNRKHRVFLRAHYKFLDLSVHFLYPRPFFPCSIFLHSSHLFSFPFSASSSSSPSSPLLSQQQRHYSIVVSYYTPATNGGGLNAFVVLIRETINLGLWKVSLLLPLLLIWKDLRRRRRIFTSAKAVVVPKWWWRWENMIFVSIHLFLGHSNEFQQAWYWFELTTVFSPLPPLFPFLWFRSSLFCQSSWTSAGLIHKYSPQNIAQKRRSHINRDSKFAKLEDRPFPWCSTYGQCNQVRWNET